MDSPFQHPPSIRVMTIEFLINVGVYAVLLFVIGFAAGPYSACNISLRRSEGVAARLFLVDGFLFVAQRKLLAGPSRNHVI